MSSRPHDHEGAMEPQVGDAHANQYPAQPPGSAIEVEAVAPKATRVSRQELIDRLNDDLAREYQAIIAYVIYSQTLKGAAFMAVAQELESHAAQELGHAITIAKHIDYLGGTPGATPRPVKVVDNANGMLRADLENERLTIQAYRERLKQCEALEEYGIAEDLREILRQEQEHLVDLSTALGEAAPQI